MGKRTIIAGGRDLDFGECLDAITATLDPKKVTEVVSGGARGADAAGEQWAREQGIPIRRFPADWDRYGKSAGPRRNEEMAAYGECLLALWNGTSRGTAHMIEAAKKRGLPTKIIRF